MRRLVLSLSVLSLLAACGGGSYDAPPATVPGFAQARGQDGALLVTRTGATPFTYSDGAEARRIADRLCGGQVNSGPEDNFQNGAWVFPGGCR